MPPPPILCTNRAGAAAPSVLTSAMLSTVMSPEVPSEVPMLPIEISSSPPLIGRQSGYSPPNRPPTMVPITMVPMVPAPGVPSVFTPVPVHFVVELLMSMLRKESNQDDHASHSSFCDQRRQWGHH